MAGTVYDANGNIIVSAHPNAGQPDGAGQGVAQQQGQDLGLEAFIAHHLKAAGLQMSGGDNQAGWIIKGGPYSGMHKAAAIEAITEKWKAMPDEQRQPFHDMGNNRGTRSGDFPTQPAGGEAPAYPSVSGNPPDVATRPAFTDMRGNPNTGAGPSPTAGARYNAMGRASEQRVQGARQAAQVVTDHYASSPAAYVDRQIEARNTGLAKDGITDMGGGNRVMQNQYGSGVATQMAPGAKRTPGVLADEHGVVDLSGKGAHVQIQDRTSQGTVVGSHPSATTYKTDATGNIAMAPRRSDTQQTIATTGASLAAGADEARAKDRGTAIAALPTTPAFQATQRQSETNAINRGVAETNRELAQPTAAQRQVQGAASSLPTTMAQPSTTAPRREAAAAPPIPFSQRTPQYV